MHIQYEVNNKITTADFIDILKRSTLAKRRPIYNLNIMENMLNNASLIICAKNNSKIVGIVRCMTDFVYCCYVSELAVDLDYQKQGIGKCLLNKVRNNIKDSCNIILLAAPAASNYYPKIGFTKHEAAFVLNNNK